MKYLSEISKQFSRLFTMEELDDIGASTSPYSIALTVSVGTGSSAHTFSIDGTCTDTLHKSSGDRWYFYGLFEYLHNIFTDYDLSISNVYFSYVAHDLSETEDDVTISESETILFCLDKVTGLTADEYLAAHALTSSDVAYFHDGQTFILPLYIVFGSYSNLPYTLKKYYFDENGDPAYVPSGAAFSSGGRKNVSIPFPTGQPYGSADNVIKVEFTCQNRTFTLYNLQEPKVETFRFRNRWNVEETVIIPCAIEQHPTTDYELATCNDIDVAYDVEHRTEHELKSAPIHSQLYETLLQLCRSHYVEYLTPSGYQRINISEYDLPRSSAPNSLIMLEMTFEMADNTPTVNLS